MSEPLIGISRRRFIQSVGAATVAGAMPQLAWAGIEPFLGELGLFPFGFPPKGWALCNGQFLPINQNQALFALLGTTYGGNGQTTFALPNLRGRTPMHFSQAHPLGESSGTESHTLTQAELPEHTHGFMVSSAAATTTDPAGAHLAATTVPAYAPPGVEPAALGGTPALLAVGGSQPHYNMQPYTVLSWCIALQGIFPSRN